MNGKTESDGLGAKQAPCFRVHIDTRAVNNPADLADALVWLSKQVRDGATNGNVMQEGTAVGNFRSHYEGEGEPAYTVIGIYCDNGQRYATTVYTHNGPEAAEQLAQEACREDNDADDETDLIEIAAVIEGEPKVLA